MMRIALDIVSVGSMAFAVLAQVAGDMQHALLFMLFAIYLYLRRMHYGK